MAESSKSPNSNSNKKSIGQYILGKTLGEGTFGKVRIGTHILTGEKVAIKVLEKDRVTDVSDVERVAREIHILKIIRHPNLIQLYEIVETTKELYLITEYATGGELYEYIVANTRIKEEEACRLFQQIISGIEYIHKLRVVHRDLKPENLLLDSNKNVKLVDFGLSTTYKQNEKLKTACGSPCYAAPEMIAGKKYDGLQVDIWSSGVVLFALLCGYLPFEDPDTGNLYKKILGGSYTTPNFLSDDAKSIIKGILTVDPEKRFTIEDIKNHPWYKVYPIKPKEGIIVGVHQIPTEPCILNQLDKYGLDPDYARKCVEANKHNTATTAYYLLMQKFIREGGKSTADFSSPLFEPVTIGKRLKTLRVTTQTDNIQRVSGNNVFSVVNKPSIQDNAPNEDINKKELCSNKSDATKSSNNDDILRKAEIRSNAVSTKACEFNKKYPGFSNDNVGELLNGKLKDYIFNLSMNLAEEQRKNFNDTIDFHSNTPLKKRTKKLRLPDKEDHNPVHKSLSTRTQRFIKSRLWKKNPLSKRQILLNMNAMPSTALRENSLNRTSFSPTYGKKSFNKLLLNKTCRLKKKHISCKTPNKRFKYFMLIL